MTLLGNSKYCEIIMETAIIKNNNTYYSEW